MNNSHHNNIEKDTITTSQTYIDIFDTIQWKKVIECDDGAELTYIAIVQWDSAIDIEIQHNGSDSSSTIHVLYLWNSWNTIQSSTESILNASSTNTTINMLTLLDEDASITVDGWVTINPGHLKVAGHLLEENLILAEKNCYISSLPRLNVQSNDVEASHWARIDRINELSLFYLTSKGISHQVASKLIVEWYLEQFFSLISDDTAEMKETILSTLSFTR